MWKQNNEFILSSSYKDHEKEVFNFIKKKFHKFLDTGKVPKLNSLLNDALEFVGLEEQELSEEIKNQIFDWYEKVTRLKYLEPFLNSDDGETQEIIIHGPHKIKIEYFNQRQEFHSLENRFSGIKLSLEALAISYEKHWNFINPFLSFSATILGKKGRVTLIHPRLLCDYSNHTFMATIRFYTQKELNFNDFNLLTTQAEWVKSQIKNKKNILISGATKSGKTSLLKLMIEQAPSDEHIVSVEDTSELHLKQKHYTSLINSEDSEDLQMKQLLKHALRMSPDRIVLGEMRGPEALSLILAMNTGHKGLMSTLHANNAVEAIERVALLFHFYGEQKALSHSKLLEIICRNIDIVIHVQDKAVQSIIEIKGVENGVPIYTQVYSDSSSLNA